VHCVAQVPNGFSTIVELRSQVCDILLMLFPDMPVRNKLVLKACNKMRIPGLGSECAMSKD